MMADRSSGDGLAGAYGANAWLVEEMYESYLADPESVSESWREFFADYRAEALPRRPRRRRREPRSRAPPSAAATTPAGHSAPGRAA